jgi:general secretion pathway protein H
MSSQRGFTLIEIMVVLAILATIIGLVAPRLIRRDPNIKSVARQFIVMSKEIRNKARLSNSTYRLAFELEGDGGKYWIEKANGPQPIDPDAYEKAKDKKDPKEKDGPPPLFQVDKSVLKKEQNLPKGLRFGSVETTNMKAPVTSGLAYIHFFSEGFVEAAAVQITNGNKLTWTLVFNPLTGQADIVEKAHSLKDNTR